ncbi:zinc metalloproteinase dpy-31-like [Haliotis asinina]|uniref:zinc metalloproteinase dpy-31-like n=1 Tax=Haliotis asinina TaxID=109174 RepID=UPI003531CC2E
MRSAVVPFQEYIICEIPLTLNTSWELCLEQFYCLRLAVAASMKGRIVSWVLVGFLILLVPSLVNAASVAVNGDERQDDEGAANVPQNDVKVGVNAASDGSSTAADYLEALDGDAVDGRKRRAAASSQNVRSEAKSIVGKTFDFNYLTKFTQNVQLTFAGKPVNLAAFTIDPTYAEQLGKFLRKESLAERLYVATKLAAIERTVAARKNKILRTFAIEDLDDPDDDIVLDPKDVDDLEKEIKEDPSLLDLNGPTSAVHRVKRKVKASPSSKWSTTVPYIITSDFDSYESDKQAILDGIQHWEDETCLDFVSDGPYVGPHLRFIRDSGCKSRVGKRPLGQDISIGEGCGTKGIVAHEIAHSLGFWHEQARPDRDTYVNIHSENIISGNINNFIGKSWEEALTLGVPYDYSSLMHYRTKSFSANGQETITSKEPDMDRTLGSRYRLSFFDVKLANYMYCNDQCSGGLTWSKCRHDRYRDPKNCNKCKCPDGWSGKICTDIKPGVNANCGFTDLTATAGWATLSSPNYGVSVYTAYSECTWRIKAPGSNERVAMRFTDKFSFHCHTTCRNYIEVRYQDLARAGPRYCCSSKPNKHFRSHGNEMLLLMRINLVGGMAGFKLRYKIESCGGCSSPTTAIESACLDTQPYQCTGVYYVDCGAQKCPMYRLNTCYRRKMTCCPGLKLIGKSCYREWAVWSTWSSCSRTCEDSGSRTRDRLCVNPPCNGPKTETSDCNREACPTE